MDDAQLVAGALAGKAECFDELYRRYRGWVQGWMTGAGMPGPEAEDRAQKVLAAVCRKLAQFDPSRAQFGTWVHGFIGKEVLSYWRQQGGIPRRNRWMSCPRSVLRATPTGRRPCMNGGRCRRA